MARMQQVMVRLSPEKIAALEEIGREEEIVIAAGPRAGEVNVSEVIRAMLAKADIRLGGDRE